MNPAKAPARERWAQAIKKSAGTSVTHSQAMCVRSRAEGGRTNKWVARTPGTHAHAPATGERTSKPARKRWAHLAQRVSLMLGALMFSLPTCAFADGGSTDVTVRGDLAQAAPTVTRSAGTLAQTGVSAGAWRLVAAGTVLALAAAAALLVLRRGRHGH